ncbi:MAG TPA: helix-turn-helix domain-containing protein [Acidimicrobiales bacterium]
MKSRYFSCGLDAAVSVVEGKWKPLILWELSQGPRRYGKLRRALPGISEKMLIQQLKQLQRDGLIARTDLGGVPPGVEYALTPLGESLNEALVPLGDWGEKHLLHLESLQDGEARHDGAASAGPAGVGPAGLAAASRAGPARQPG